MVEYNNVEYEYDFKNNSWLKCTRFSSGRICITHNSPHQTTPLDPPIPEEIVLKVAHETFGSSYEVYHTLLSTDPQTYTLRPSILTAYKEGVVYRIYDYKTEKFLIKPTIIKPKMTLEQKKTLIKMIHEI